MSDVVLTDFDEFWDNIGDESYLDKNKESKDGRIFFFLKVIAFVLGFALLAEGVLYAVIFPCFGTARVTYSGLNSLSRDDVSEKLSAMPKSSWIQFDTEKAVSILGTVSSIESVSVDKHFPDLVSIKIKERQSVAKTIVNINGHSKTIQIDENGVIFSLHHNSNVQDSSVPLISGLPIENLQEGMRLPAKYRALMEQIAVIRKLPQKYFAAISEIQVVTKEYGNYELVLYPVQTKVKVLTDRSLNEDALKYMMVALDVVNKIEPNASEIDLRYGSVSYRTKSVGTNLE